MTESWVVLRSGPARSLDTAGRLKTVLCLTTGKMSAPLVTISILFAVITAAAGFALSLVGWQIFRGAPFGRLMGFLSVILFVLMSYHGLLLVVDLEAVPFLETLAFVALLLWVVLMIRQHHRMSRRPEVTDRW